MKGNKIGLIALAVLASGATPSTNAGTEIVRDYSGDAPMYDYTPPPPPARVYVAPPPVRVVVYPTYRYYVAPVRVYSFRRLYGQRVYCAPDRWR